MRDFNSHNVLWGNKTTNKRGQILKKINSNNLYLHNQNSQTYLNPSSGSFSVLDLTLSDPLIFIDWRVYKDPCGSDHYPIMENYNKKLRTPNKTPSMEFQKSKLANLQKNCVTTLISESNTNLWPKIHFTNTLITIANKTISKTTISPKHNKPWFTEECKNIRECQATLRNFKTNPSSENLNKYKQQRAKTQHIIKEAKRSSWRTFTLKINSNTNPHQKFGTSLRK